MADVDQTKQVPPQPGLRSYFDPVVGIAVLILISVFAMIGYSMLDNGNGLLGRMAESSFARGLITYLFAVVTIGTAVVLVVSALTNGVTDTDEKKFQRGKEILALLLGVFGTIVGFYFGTEISESRFRTEQGIFLTTLFLDKRVVAAGNTVTVSANVRDGIPPYRYGIAFGKDASVDFTNLVGSDGWIVTTLTAPDVGEEQTVLSLGVRDELGKSVIKTTGLRITSAAKE